MSVWGAGGVREGGRGWRDRAAGPARAFLFRGAPRRRSGVAPHHSTTIFHPPHHTPPHPTSTHTEKLEELRALNRKTYEETGEYMSEEEIRAFRQPRWTDRREFVDDD